MDAAAAQYDDVCIRELVLVKTEGFSQQAFQSIALHSPPCGFAADYQAEARITQSIEAAQQHQVLPGDPQGGLPQDGAERVPAVQALLRRQPETRCTPSGHTGRNEERAVSVGKPLAPFLAAPADELATAAGGHACAKSVIALAPNYTGLIGAFHGVIPPGRRLEQRRIIGQNSSRVKRKTASGAVICACSRCRLPQMPARRPERKTLHKCRLHLPSRQGAANR